MNIDRRLTAHSTVIALVSVAMAISAWATRHWINDTRCHLSELQEQVRQLRDQLQKQQERQVTQIPSPMEAVPDDVDMGKIARKLRLEFWTEGEMMEAEDYHLGLPQKTVDQVRQNINLGNPPVMRLQIKSGRITDVYLYSDPKGSKITLKEVAEKFKGKPATAKNLEDLRHEMKEVITRTFGQ